MMKKIALSAGVILFVGALAVSGTWAYFSSQAAAVGNSFTTGTLDLKLTRIQDGGTPETTKDAQWDFTNMAPGGTPEESSIWLRNTGSIAGAHVSIAAAFSGQGSIAKQMRVTTLEWDGNDLLAGAGVGADLSEYEEPTSCDILVETGTGDHDTITDAIEAATDGDVICVAGGDYSRTWEASNSTIGSPLPATNQGILVDKEVTLVSTTGPSSHTISAGLVIDADNVTVRGFTLTPLDVQTGVDPTAIYLDNSHSGITITGNDIDGAGVGGSIRGIITETGAAYTGLSVEGNEIHDFITGMYTNPHTGVLGVMYNDFYNNTAAIGGFTGVDAQYNRFYDNTEAIGADSSYPGDGATLTNNEFLNDDVVNDYGVSGSLDAEGNWWGDLDPSDQVSGSVDYDPFATGPIFSPAFDGNGNGYFDMHDFRASGFSGLVPGLDPYDGSNDKEFVMGVQLDSSTGNSFQGQTLSDVTVEFTLDQN